METVRTPSQFGAALQRKRKQLQLTQTELGNKAGLRQATISNLEAGLPTVRVASVMSVLAAMDLEIQLAPRSRSSSADVEDLFK